MTTSTDIPAGAPEREPKPVDTASATDPEALRRERAERLRAERAKLDQERSETSVAPPGAIVEQPVTAAAAAEHKSFKLSLPEPKGPGDSSEHRSFKLTTKADGAGDSATETEPSSHKAFRLTR
jgi:hypothetical protein